MRGDPLRFLGVLGALPARLSGQKNGSRGRTRTYNHTVNSRVLYH